MRSKRVNFLVMTNMSLLAALAGMMFVARSNASGPFDGVGWELDAIAAVFIGGAAVTGGVGTVIGSIVGGLVMAVLNNGLQLLGSRRRRDSDDQGPRAARRRRPSTSTTSRRAGRRIIGLFMRNRRSKGSDGDAVEAPTAASEIEKLDETLGQRS